MMITKGNITNMINFWWLHLFTTLATWWEELTLEIRPWCWERLKAGGKGGEMVGWHHWLNGHESEQALGDGEAPGSLACCSPSGGKEPDTTERLNSNVRQKCSLLFLLLLKISPSSQAPHSCLRWRGDKYVEDIISSVNGCLIPLV